MALDFADPPLPESLAPDVEESRRLLAEFIRWTGYFLEMIGEFRDAEERDGVRYFEEELATDYLAALEEFLEFGHIERVAQYLEDAPAPALIDHGLVGRQLRLKLRIPQFRVASLRGVFDRRARAILAALLASINSLLGSIMQVVPGGAAIDELKQAVENMKTMADEAEND